MLAFRCFALTCLLLASVAAQRSLANSKGKFKLLVLLVKHADQADRVVPPREYYDTLCNGKIREYFLEQSYNQYDVSCVVQDWKVLATDEAAAAQGKSGALDTLQASKFFEPVLKELSDSEFDFFQFDSDGDGFLDNVLVIHSGFSSATPGTGSCGENPALNRIRSQGHTGSTNLFSQAWMDPVWELQLSGYVIASAFERLCNFEKFAGMGVITHELIHTFGEPGSNPIDTYDTSTGNVGGLGSFDIMAHPGGYTGSTLEPGSMSPFSKQVAGWLTYEEITLDGTYTAKPSNTAPNVYSITKGFKEGEYLVIENRQPTSFDANLFGGVGGLLIYHCDETVDGFGTKGFPGQAGWPTNGNHYKCAILPADGQYDLEQGVNNGDAGDLWKPGMTLGPGSGGTYPNTDSYQNGVIAPTGITISSIEAIGSDIRFTVSGVAPGPGDGVVVPPAPLPTKSPVQAPTGGGGVIAPAPLPTESPVQASTGGGGVIAPAPLPTESPVQAPTGSGVVVPPAPLPTEPPMQSPSIGNGVIPTPTISPVRAPTGTTSAGMAVTTMWLSLCPCLVLILSALYS